MATSSTSRQTGFGHVTLIIVLIVVLLVTAIGVVVYRRSGSNNDAITPKTSNPPAQQPTTMPTPQQTVDPYEGMTKYTNDEYGFSFYHPKEWRVEERDPQLTADPEKTQLSLWLVDAAVKERAEAAIFTVVDRSLTEVGPIGDGDHSKYKQELTIKGKQAVKYSIPQSASVNREMYLIAVGSKTYSVETIYEATNIARTPDYMAKFNKLVDSLALP